MSFRKITICICFLITSQLSFGQTLDPGKEKFIDSVLNANYPAGMPGISVIVSKDGKPLYKKAFGMADMEADLKLKTDNVFAIGSMTKQFTAVAVLMLVQDGKLNLTDDVKKYLPDYNTHGKTITLKHLLTHTSGIPSYTEMKSFVDLIKKEASPEEIINMFKDTALLFDPGTNWSYSNAGYMLAAYIVERVSGMEFNNFLIEKIFKPLEMKNTYIGSFTKIIPKRARGYDPSGTDHVQNTDYYSWSWPYGAGNILSTTGDLLKWDEALYSDKLVKKDLLDIAFKNFKFNDGRSVNYGYGWAINDFDNHTVIFHGGAIGGYLSEAVRIPDEHIYIAGLTNTTKTSPADIINSIALKMIGYDIKMPDKIQIDETVLEDYKGVFEANMSGLRVVTNMGSEKEYRYVTTEDGNLYSTRSGGSKRLLIPVGKDKFYTKDGTTVCTFVRNSDNKVIAINLSSYPLQYGPVEISQKTDLTLPDLKENVTVDEAILKSYEGTYQLQPGFDLVVYIKDGKFYTEPTGQAPVILHPQSDTHFFIKEVDAQVDFNKDSSGKVISLTLTQGQKFECRKTK
ncbi:MAG: serine hydrolase [bacterium]|nr:serine hydrolase [bacterium]